MRTSRMALIGSVVSILAISGCTVNNDNNYQLGNNRYCLPAAQGIFQYGVTSPQWNIPGADIDNQPTSFMLDFSAQEIKEAIPSYELFNVQGGGLLFATVSRPGKDYIHDFLRQPGYQSTLDLSGDEQYVNYDEALSIYRVSLLPLEQDILWTILTLKPEKGREVPEYFPDYVQGSCVRDISYGAKCSAYVGIDDFLIKIEAPEVNLHLKQELAEFVVKKLDAWEQACEN